MKHARPHLNFVCCKCKRRQRWARGVCVGCLHPHLLFDPSAASDGDAAARILKDLEAWDAVEA